MDRLKQMVNGLSLAQVQDGPDMEATRLEYDRGRGNFRWSREMHRDRKEH